MPEFTGRLRTPRLSAAPSSPVVGEMYYDTVTNILNWWNGTAWVSASGGGGGAALPADTVVAAATRIISNMTAAGDAGPSWQVRGDGSMLWGDTSGSLDTKLYRRGAAALQTDGQLWVTPGSPYVGLIYMSSSLTGGAIQHYVTGDTNPRFQIDASGNIVWGPGGTSGLDATLYRAGIGILKTDNTLRSAIGFQVDTNSTSVAFRSTQSAANPVLRNTLVSTDSQPSFAVGGDGAITWGAGGASATDITLARISSGVLKITGALARTSYGTVLPAGTVDGREFILVDSTTAPTWFWYMRYNASSTSAYKWEYLGGHPAVVTIAADIAPTTLSAWVDFTGSVGPEFIVPRNGDYKVDYAGRISCSAAGQVNIGVANNSFSATPPGMTTTWQTPTAGAWYVPVAGHTIIPGCLNGDRLRLKINTNISSGACGQRSIAVTPIRLS